MQLELTADHCKLHQPTKKLLKAQGLINFKQSLPRTSCQHPSLPASSLKTVQYSLMLFSQRRASSGVSGITCHNSYYKCSLAASHLSTDFA